MAEPPDLDVDVVGDPRPQGSHKAIIPRNSPSGKPIVIEDNPQQLKDWRRSVVVAARESWTRPPLHGPVAVNLAFRVTRPRQPDYPLPAKRPDIDKMTRAVLDALTQSRVYRDDGQVVQLHVTKVYESDAAPPGCRIRLWSAL